MENRKNYLDILRISSFICVVTIHSLGYIENRIHNDYLRTLIVGIISYAVPMFVMMSGVNLLERDYSPISIWKKKIVKMLIALYSWSFIYAISLYCTGSTGLDLDGAVSSFVCGPYHMWFLFMIIGLYMVTPLINAIMKKEYCLEYFLIISFLTTFIFPQINRLPISSMGVVIEKMGIKMGLGYVFYYLYGYYLDHNKHKLVNQLVCCMGIIAFIIRLFIGTFNDFDILTALSIGMIFIVMKSLIRCKKEMTQKIIYRLSNNTFGGYLCHVLILDFLVWMNKYLGIKNSLFLPAGVVIISLLISEALKKIPLIKKIV